VALVIMLCPAGEGYTENIDGVDYYAPLVDASRHLQVDVLETAWPAFPDTVVSGQETVASAGTRVQLADQACKSVLVKALAGNAGKVYVGGSDVSSANGLELSAGDSVGLAVTDVNKLYIDAGTDADGVSWLAVS